MSNKSQEGFAHDFSLTKVPDEKRKSLWSLIAVWVGWAVSISAFMTGGVIGGGLPAGKGLLAVLTGNLFLVLVASLVGIIGFRTGFTTSNISRIVFGKKGSVIVSLALGILAMGFIGVLMNSFALALNALIPIISIPVALILFAIAITLSSIYGFKGLAVLSNLATPAMWLFLAIGLTATIRKVGSFGAIFDVEPKATIPFSTGMGAAIATWITGTALVSDISRYAQKASHVVVGAFAGYIFGSALFEGASVLTTLGAGNPDIVKIMSTLGLLAPGVLLLALALWTTAQSNVYSTSLAFVNVGEIVNINISKPVMTVIAVIIAFLTSLLGLAAKFLVWLQFIGTLMPPFAGVLIAHFWLLHPGKNEYKVMETWRPSAFISWIAAVVIARYSGSSVPAIIGLVAAVVLYYILGKLMDKELSLDSNKKC